MPDSIREQLLTAWATRLTSLLISNQYSSDMGSNVLRAHLPPINSSILPCVGFHVGVETNTKLYHRINLCVLPVTVQGVVTFSSVLPSIMAERIYADIAECILSDEITLSFVAGGATEIIAGNKIVGETSAAEGLVISVSVNSGSWGAGNAAGTFTLRRNKGVFSNGEEIKVGVQTGLATVDGAPVGSTAMQLSTGGIADAISFANGGVVMPENEDLTVLASLVFDVRYKVRADNPYSQT
jgi:hypothetical protein